GTDGIRGVANTGWFTPTALNKLGRIIGQTVPKGKNVIIGRDPRASGLRIERALTAGITSGGVNVTKCGIVSTPALAYLTKRDRHNLGIMISASHNPADDNGIKLFAANGLKVNRKTELVIENYLLDDKFRPTRPAKRGAATDNPAEIETYINDTLQNIFGRRSSLKGLRIVLDCANGGVSTLAPAIFSRLDAEVITLNNRPDGRNINCNCGSLYPEAVSKAVLKHKADIGFSFDGDVL
ncbi:MAG: phosphoglucosamine mutase, partial [Planctomycetes bacterium]|nr:phosphoglucosamine mutase [Planctomycetota bacterium]